MRAFVDTSAWIALLAPKDANHASAQRAFAQLLAGNALAVASNRIVAETVT